MDRLAKFHNLPLSHHCTPRTRVCPVRTLVQIVTRKSLCFERNPPTCSMVVVVHMDQNKSEVRHHQSS